MHKCGECVGYHNSFACFGLCYRGEKYARSMGRKGSAPVRCTISPACKDFRRPINWKDGSKERPGARLTWAQVDELVGGRPERNNLEG